MNAPPSAIAPDAALQAVFGLLPGAYLLFSPQLQVELVSAGYQAAEAAGWPHLPVSTYAPVVLAAAPAGQCLAAKLLTSLVQVLLTSKPHEAACRHNCPEAGQALSCSLASGQLVSQLVHDAAGVVNHVLCHISPNSALPTAGLPGPAPLGEVGLLALLAQLPVAVCLLRGPRYVVEMFNPLASRMWGLSAAQALGRPFLDLLPLTTVAHYAVACAEVARNGQPAVWPEVLVAGLATAGSTALGPLYFSLRFQALPPEQGTLEGLLLIAQDITPLLQARQQTQQLRADLAATTAGLADYVAELLHAPTSKE